MGEESGKEGIVTDKPTNSELAETLEKYADCPCPECGDYGVHTVPAHADDCRGECQNCPQPEPEQCDWPQRRELFREAAARLREFADGAK